MTMPVPAPVPADPPAAEVRPGSRAARMRSPLARQVVEAVALDHGVCVRPLAMRRTSLDTGETQIIPVACGATLASKCPPCAERARRLRMAQCKTGWHLDDEPVPEPDPLSDDAKTLAVLRADLEEARGEVLAAGDTVQVGEIDELIDQVDVELSDLGVRGRLAPADRDRRRGPDGGDTVGHHGQRRTPPEAREIGG